MNQVAQNSKCIVAMMMAMDKNKLIGKTGGMPWHIPGEQIYFKSVTMGKPIIMGRKTFDSIGKPLPGRPNFVVTRNRDWHFDGVHVCASLDDAIKQSSEWISENALDEKSPEVVVIGGAGLCREAMPITDRLYLTVIEHEYEGDVWLDSFNWNDWQERSRKELEHDGLKYAYLVLEPKAT